VEERESERAEREPVLLLAETARESESGLGGRSRSGGDRAVETLALRIGHPERAWILNGLCSSLALCLACSVSRCWGLGNFLGWPLSVLFARSPHSRTSEGLVVVCLKA
jgi:hypothetical protein